MTSKNNPKEKDTSEMALLYERYTTLLRATNDAIWDWDILSDELIWSENFHALFGYHHTDLGGNLKWWEENVHPEDKNDVLQNMHSTIVQKESRMTTEYRFRGKNGLYRFVRVRGFLFYDEDGNAKRMIGSMQDIDQLKRHEQILLKQNELLKEIAHLQAHEIRGPLASIMGLNNLIQHHLNTISSADSELIAMIHHMNNATLNLDAKIKKSIWKMSELDYEQENNRLLGNREI